MICDIDPYTDRLDKMSDKSRTVLSYKPRTH